MNAVVVFASAAAAVTATVTNDANLSLFSFFFPSSVSSGTIRPGKTEEFEGPVSNTLTQRTDKRACK